MEDLGAVLEAKLTVLRPTWEHLGTNLEGFGATLDVLEATLHDFVDVAKTLKNKKTSVFIGFSSIGGSSWRLLET